MRTAAPAAASPARTEFTFLANGVVWSVLLTGVAVAEFVRGEPEGLWLVALRRAPLIDIHRHSPAGPLLGGSEFLAGLGEDTPGSFSVPSRRCPGADGPLSSGGP
jgi:hypothetical protein